MAFAVALKMKWHLSALCANATAAGNVAEDTALQFSVCERRFPARASEEAPHLPSFFVIACALGAEFLIMRLLPKDRRWSCINRIRDRLQIDATKC